MKDWLGNTTSFGYDPDGDPTSITFPAGTGESDVTSYDHNDRAATITDKQGSATLASETYTRDATSQVTGETGTLQGKPNTTSTYSYSALDQLTGATASATAITRRMTRRRRPGRPRTRITLRASSRRRRRTALSARPLRGSPTTRSGSAPRAPRPSARRPATPTIRRGT